MGPFSMPFSLPKEAQLANTAANVLSGKPLASGGVLIGPLGTAAPADATTALNAAYLPAGYIHEDGLTEAIERAIEKIKAWGGDTVKVVQTEHGVQYKFTFIETLNSTVLGAVYGVANVTTTAASSTKGTLHKVKLNGAELPHQAFVFEVKDGKARIRIAVADGQITEVGEITYSDADVIAYPVTVECFPDANGDKAIKFIDDGIFSS